MIKIIDNDIYRDGQKIGWITKDHIYDKDGEKVGRVAGNDIYNRDGQKIGYTDSGHVIMRSGSKKLSLDEARRRVSSDRHPDLTRAAVHIFMGN